MRIGSLFSGYGGLDMAVAEVLGASTAWVSDIDPGACRILAHRYPDVPNIGDLTAVDWSQVEPVDIIAGGFPCTDVSHAGKRAGLRPGTRSGLWSHMAHAISQLRPALVVAENVRGLLSAEADSDVEPCPWCLGDTDGEPVMRALGAVLADLALIGYDAEWCGLRAADVGAAHGRFRVFVVAWPQSADADDARPQGAQPAARRLMPTGTPPDAGSERYGPGEDARGVGRVDSEDAGGARERERSRPVVGDRGVAAPADAERRGLDGRSPVTVGNEIPRAATPRCGVTDAPAAADSDGQPLVGRVNAVRRDSDGCGSADIAWGAYEPAVKRWEHVTGRVAPAPTQTGAKGGPQLSPRFVEWLMGLPAGHVTDPAIWRGMTPSAARNAQLKALGNGVVPQQAAAALRVVLQGAAARKHSSERISTIGGNQ